MIYAFPNPSRNRGMSIIELMISITLSMIIMTGVLSLFVSNKQTYEITDDLSRLQENARFAMEFIANDVRMAGYFGCADNQGKVDNQINTAGTGWDELFATSNPVDGYEQGATSWSRSGNTTVGSITAGTDAISIRYIDPGTGVNVVAPFMANTAAAITVNPAGTLGLNELVAVTDCESADIFQITATAPLAHATGAGNPGNIAVLSKIYEGDAKVLKLMAVRYYIDDDANGVPALYRDSIDLNAGGNPVVVNQQLVDGIENLQILYGEDTSGDGTPDIYRTAAAVVNWDNVVTARIGILARTIDEYGQDPDQRNYDLFAGTTGCTIGTDAGCVATTNLRVQRRMFSATVVMRNLQ